MFTGIIEAKVKVLNITKTNLEIKRPVFFENLKIGQSIAINGACLTVTILKKDKIGFDVIPETFACTNLADSKIVNLERALKASGRFEGHIVQGHVDGKIKLLARKIEGEGERFTFTKPVKYSQFFVPKGSIALNGISLTIASSSKDNFSVAIIPHTLEKTNFQELKINEEVNFECDVLLKFFNESITIPK